MNSHYFLWSLLAILQSAVFAEDSANATSSTTAGTESCDISQAISLKSLLGDDIAEELSGVDTIKIGGSCDCDDDGGIIAPDRLGWHIYPMDDLEEAQILMSPEGIVEATVHDGMLDFQLQNMEAYYSIGANVQAGVALWVPTKMLKELNVAGIDELVQVVGYNGTDTLKVENSGIDTSVIIESLQAAVHYEGKGIDCLGHIEAGAPGSKVELSGIDAKASISIPGNDTSLTATLKGIDTRLYILQGEYDSLSASGIDAQVFVVDGKCSNVRLSGIDAGCSAISSDKKQVVSEFSCLSATQMTLQERCGWGFFSEYWKGIVGAVVGVGIGILVMTILCVGGCITCCCLCGRRRATATKTLETPTTSTTNKKYTAQPPVQAWDPNSDKEVPAIGGGPTPALVEAQAFSAEEIDPHLVTAKTGVEQHPKYDAHHV